MTLTRRQTLSLACPLGAGLPAWADAPPLRALLLDTDPFGYRDGGGELAGLYVELVHRLAREAGVPVAVDIAPVARVVQEINRGTADFTLLLPYEFDPRVRSLGAVLPLEVLLWPRQGLVLTRPEDIAGRSVVSFKGTPVQRALPASVDANRQHVGTARAMVAMLKAGRVDAALGVRETLLSGLRALGLRGSAAEGFGVPLSLGSVDVFLWARPELPAAQGDLLARALKAVQQSGELARLRQRYLGELELAGR